MLALEPCPLASIDIMWAGTRSLAGIYLYLVELALLALRFHFE